MKKSLELELINKDVKLDKSWLEVGKEYMENTRNLDEWTSFLNGYVHTNSRITILSTGSSQSSVGINSLKSVFPNKEEAVNVCKTLKLKKPTRYGRRILKYGYDSKKISIYDMRSKDYAIDDICRSAEVWDDIKEAIDICKKDPEDTPEAREKLLKLRREGKLYGFNRKGIDMLLLDSGCNTIVLDMWLLEKYFGVDKPDEETRRSIQLTKKYDEARDMLEDLVKKENADEGYGIGAWHVGMWLKTTTGGDLDKAKKFIADLFGE